MTSLLFLLLLATGLSPGVNAWINGFHFKGKEAFAELPPTSLCGELSFRMDFKPDWARSTLLVAYNSRRRLLITLQASKPFFNLTIVDLKRKAVRRRLVHSTITLPYMFADWKAIHEFELTRVGPGKLFFRIDQISKTVRLHTLGQPFPMEFIRSTRFFISRPPKKVLAADDEWILQTLQEPSFRGYVRNVRGARDCDCAQHRRINFMRSQQVAMDNLEPCEKQNPCGVGCVCHSWGQEPECQCKKTVTCPEFSSFDYKLGMDQMLNNKVPNTAGLTAQASGQTEVNSEHAVQDRALKLRIPGSDLLIGEPPDARTCFSHLAKCEAGFSMALWLRVENPSLRHQSQILRHETLAVCRYGLTLTYSIADGLEVEFETQAGHKILMRTRALHPEQWMRVIVVVPDASEPAMKILLDGREQKDPNVKITRQDRQAGTMVKCRSDLVRLGGKLSLEGGDPEGNHFVLVDNLEFRNPPISLATLNQFDISHFVLTSAGTYGEIFQLQSLGPDASTYKLTTKGVQKLSRSTHRSGALVLTPVTDGVLVLRERPESRATHPCLFDFAACRNGLYMSAWVQLTDASVSAPSVRLLKWNGLKVLLRKGVPTLELVLGRETWSIVDNTEKLPVNVWVFLEATWDLTNGLELWVQRKKVGRFQHSFGTEANPTVSPQVTDSVLVLGANVEFQLDDFQLRTANRRLLMRMERLSHEAPKVLAFPLDGLKEGRTASSSSPSAFAKLVGAGVSSVDGKVGQGLRFSANKPAFLDFGPSYRHNCLGNLNHCPNGFTFVFWLRPDAIRKAKRSPFLRTGYNGIGMFWADAAGHIEVEARTSIRTWSVRSQRPLFQGQFNFVEVTWDPRRGLRIFLNLKLSGVDVLPQKRKFSKDEKYNEKDDRFLLGAIGAPYAAGGSFVVDNLDLWAASRNFLANWNLIVRELTSKKPQNDSANNGTESETALAIAALLRPWERDEAQKSMSDIAFAEYATIPFEWASPSGQVPNSRFSVQLQQGALIVPYGRIGSAVNIEGASKGFVSLGRRFDCYGTLDSCSHGLTLRFWLHPKALGQVRARRMMVLASSTYEIFIGTTGNLNFVFKASGKLWISRKYELKSSQWQLIEASWSPLEGLRIYADTYKIDVVPSGLPSIPGPIYDDPNIYIGRASSMDDFDYGDILVDEMQFWQTSIDYLHLNSLAYISSLRTRYFPLEGVQVDRLYGNASVVASGRISKTSGVKGYGLDFSEGGFLDFGPEFLCRENNLAFCPNGFTLRFWIQPRVQEKKTEAPVVSSGSAFKAELIGGKLVVNLWSHGRHWQAATKEKLYNARWYVLELSWQRDEGLVIFMDGKRSGADFEPKPAVLVTKELAGMKVGGQAVLDELKVFNAKLGVVIAGGAINRADDREHLLLSMPMSDAGHVGEIDYVRFLGSNYLEFDFSKVNIPYSVVEHLSIEFQTTKRNGLIWFGRQNNVANYLELKDGVLVFHLVYAEPSGQVTDHKYNMKRSTVTDGQKHVVKIESSKSDVKITTDGNKNNDEIRFDGRNKVYLQPKGVVYLGGMPNINLFRTNFFDGKIFSANVEADWGRMTNLLRDIDKYPHRSSMGAPAYVMKKKPTNPSKWKATPRESSPTVGLLKTLTQTKIPYTFYNSKSKLYLPPWSFPLYKSIELEFQTLEPEGVLFYIGSGVHGRCYVAIEIFDNVLYSIYSNGQNSQRTKLSTHSITEDHKHNLLIKVFEEGYIEVRADFVNIPIPKMPNSLKFEFDSYTYIAGVDVYDLDANRLPWEVWSRSGFIGCVHFIKINDLGYYDGRKYQVQHSTTERSIGECIKPKAKHCQGSNDCVHGTCHQRWTQWIENKNFFCDCTMSGYTYSNSSYVKMRDHEVRGQHCTKPAVVFSSRGSRSQVVIFEPKLLKTHVDHIQLEFKTKTKDNAMFMTELPLSQNTLMAYMREGRVHVATSVHNMLRTPAIKDFVVGNKRYDDGKWHILRFLRRANSTWFTIDKEDPKIDPTTLGPAIKLPKAPRAYYLNAKRIHIGKFPTTSFGPPFKGKMRSFTWNAFDFFTHPLLPNIYRSEFQSIPKPKAPFELRPTAPLNNHPVTVRDGTKFIILPKFFLPTDAHGGTFSVSFRTDRPNVNIFTLSNGDQTLRLDLNNGRPVYSTDFGKGVFSPKLDPTIGKLHDQNYHQAFVAVLPEDQDYEHILYIDRNPNKLGRFPADPKNLKPFRAILGGNEPKRIRRRRRRLVPVMPFTGCFGSADVNGKAALDPKSVIVNPGDKKTVTFGRCIDPKRCTVGWCKNGGSCVQLGWSRITCACPAHLFEGDRCEKPKTPPKCPVGYCKNSGVCSMKLGNPVCDCSATQFKGARCEQETRCPDHFCYNFGVCSVTADDKFQCDCNLTAHTGPRCKERAPALLTPYKGPSYYIVPALPHIKQPTKLDLIAIAFQTWLPNGHLATFQMTNGQRFSLLMRDGSLFLSLGGIREYSIGGPLNDGQYHVVNLIRMRDVMDIVLNGINVRQAVFSDYAKQSTGFVMFYKQAILGANAAYRTFFRGVISGFYWNGFFPIPLGKASWRTGNIQVVQAPYDLAKPTTTNCPKDFCKNCGRCYEERLGVIRCDCWRTGYSGHFCDEAAYFGILNTNIKYGKLEINVKNPVASWKSRLRFAFQTFSKSGPLVCLVAQNGKFWKLFLRDGYIVLSVNGQEFDIKGQKKPMNDGKFHVVTVDRNAESYSVFFNACKTASKHESAAATVLNQFSLMTAVIGSDCTSQQHFYGLIGAFNWRGRTMLNQAGAMNQGIMRSGRFEIVKMPYPLSRPGATPRPPPRPIVKPKPKPVRKPTPGPILVAQPAMTKLGSVPLIAGLLLGLLLLIGALVWACIYCKPGCCFGAPAKKNIPGTLSKPFNPYKKPGSPDDLPLLNRKGLQSAPPPDVGLDNPDAFQAGAPTAPPPMDDVDKEDPNTFQAASAAPMGDVGMGDPAPFQASPLEEEMPLMYHASTMMAHSTTAAPQMAVTSMTLPSHKQGASLLYAADEGFASLGTLKSHAVMGTEHAEAMHREGNHAEGMHRSAEHFESTHRFGEHFESMHRSGDHVDSMHRFGGPVDLGFETSDGSEMEQNAFGGELKVDCCIMTLNSKYAVTGSAMGAPQVWELERGSLIKVMDGEGVGCSGLHLAHGDSVLIGQVIDDLALRFSRLQLWNFASGRQMKMPMEIVCSALCVANNDEQAVIARCEAGSSDGFSILLWDLSTNNPVNETLFMPPSGFSDSAVTFLKVTSDDRFAVAGFANAFTQQANYMVFDLSMVYPPGTVLSPHIVDFDANLDCTVLLPNGDEAVTGTRQGALIIWDLHSGRSVRRITISAQLESKVSSKLSAHSSEVRAMTLSEDGEFLVTGSADRFVRIWRMSEEKLYQTLEGHKDDVMSVAISLDNELVVSGSYDGSIRVWKVPRNGAQLCWFTSNIEVFDVKLSANKEVLVALGERTEVRKLIMLKIVRNKQRKHSNAVAV